MEKETVKMPVESGAKTAQVEPPVQATAPEQTDVPVENTASQIKELVLKYNPELNLEDQAGMNAAVLSLLQKLDNVHEKLLVAVENDPDFGAALSEIFKGGNARTALARAYGPDAFTAVDGDPDFDEMTTAFAEGQKRIGEKRKRAETIRKNQEMSVKEITDWMESKGYDDASIEARLQKMDEIRQDFLDDRITKSHLELIDKAMDFDTAVQQAEEAGKVAGRNEKIIEKREKAKTATDGLPTLTGQAPKAAPERPKSLLEQLAAEEKMM